MSKYDNILSKLASPPSWSAQSEAALLEPYTYITANPGKETSRRCIEAFNLWLSVPAPKLEVIIRIASMLHSVCLLVDDIEDGSHLRRGRPVAHKIYGIPQTLNSANYVYFLAYQELMSLRDQDSSQSGADERGHSLEDIFIEELLAVHRGQGLELFWRDSLHCPTEEEYISMVKNKTAGFLRLGIKLSMAYASKNSDVDYLPLVNLIGVFYQIRDDLMNLLGSEYTKNKGFADDLTEGKFSFPIVHSIHADTTNRQVLNVLQKRSATPELKKLTIEYLRTHTKSFDYTFAVLETLEAQIREEVRRLSGNPMLERIVDLLSVNSRKEEGV